MLALNGHGHVYTVVQYNKTLWEKLFIALVSFICIYHLYHKAADYGRPIITRQTRDVLKTTNIVFFIRNKQFMFLML